MNALLVRVGVDQSVGGGFWNGPIDGRSNEFAYVPIPETKPVRDGMQKPYAALVPALSKFGVSLPAHLSMQHMHLDPDFDIVIRAQPTISGRLQRSIPIGEWRDGAYRVRRDVLEAWGGLSVRGGYLQRSARLPEIIHPKTFLDWFYSQAPDLLQANN